VQRHIITGVSNKDFLHLLNDYKVARRVRNAAQNVAGAIRGGGRRGGGGGLRSIQFDPNAEDRDGDGLIQDGTRFERPKKPSKPNTFGRLDTPAAAPMSKRRRRKIVDDVIAESFSDMANAPMSRRQKRRQIAAEREGNSEAGKPSSRGVPVFQPLTPAKRKSRIREYVEARRNKKRPTIYGQSLSEDFSDEQKRFMLDNFYKINPLSRKVVQGAKNIDEEIEMLMEWMLKNSEETALRAGMIVNGELTLRARIAQRWYDVANKFNTSIANRHRIRPEAVHATMAIFSAKTGWPVNVGGGLHAVNIMAANPTLAADDFVKMRADRIDTLVDKNEKDAEKLRKAQEILDPKNKKSTPSERAQAEKDKKNAEARMKKTKIELENIEKWSLEEWAKNIGGKIDGKLRDQPPKVGGRYIKTQERFGLDGGSIRAIEFDVKEDGTYTPIITKNSAVMAHDPEVKHAKVFEILKAAFDGDEDAMYELIDKNLGDGAKVRSFYNNMSDPNEADFASVTIDTHQAGLLVGVPGNNSDEWFNKGIFGEKGKSEVGAPFAYPLMKEATERFAEKYGLMPREAQSILWEAQRLTWNSNESLKPRAVEMIKEFALKENTTPDQVREYAWQIYNDIYGEIRFKTPTPYDGSAAGYLP
jgi:hypothetical protein